LKSISSVRWQAALFSWLPPPAFRNRLSLDERLSIYCWPAATRSWAGCFAGGQNPTHSGVSQGSRRGRSKEFSANSKTSVSHRRKKRSNGPGQFPRPLFAQGRLHPTDHQNHSDEVAGVHFRSQDDPLPASWNQAAYVRPDSFQERKRHRRLGQLATRRDAYGSRWKGPVSSTPP